MCINNNQYVIGGTCNEPTPSIEVQIFDRSSGEWWVLSLTRSTFIKVSFRKLDHLFAKFRRIIPTVLGTKPKQSKGHSAVFLNNDRILVVKAGSSPDESIWFLEVVPFKFLLFNEPFWFINCNMHTIFVLLQVLW